MPQYSWAFSRFFRLLPVAALLAGFAFAIQPARPTQAGTLTVTTTADELVAGNAKMYQR